MKQRIKKQQKGCRTFEKINNIDKPLARLTKKLEDSNYDNRNKCGDISTDLTDIQSVVKEHHQQANANKLDNPDEMDKLLEAHKLPKLTPEEIEKLTDLQQV